MSEFQEVKNLKLLYPEEFNPTQIAATSSASGASAIAGTIKSTRKDLQISRRLFHMGNGFVVATAYALTLSHQQVVYILGTFASLIYLLDQIRRAYPEIAKKFEGWTKYLLRAEEQLKESAAIPYAMAIMLTILSFPKIIALISIYTLAFADPLSAIIGIRFGKHHIVKEKSVEGSLAFYICSFLAILMVFSIYNSIALSNKFVLLLQSFKPYLIIP